MVSRRDFFRGTWLKDFTSREGDGNKVDPYFASFSSCYALLSEIPLEELLETARMRGIDTGNKSKLELVKELYSIS